MPFPQEAAKKKQELVVLIAPGPLTLTAAAAAAVGSDDEAQDDASMLSGAGLEHDLVEGFARTLGVPVRFVVTTPDRIRPRLAQHEAHLAASWLSPAPGDAQLGLIAGPAYQESASVLVGHEDAPPPQRLDQLGRTPVAVLEGSRQHRTLRELQKHHPELSVVALPVTTGMELLDAVAGRRVQLALVDRALLDIALNFYPMLTPGAEVGGAYPIAWLFPADGDPELYRRAQAYFTSLHGQPMTRLNDRYLGHVKRLDNIAVNAFIERIKTRLPRYRALFEEAAAKSELDWRLLAALAYQESQWDPLNTSPTGVRGMMMLTNETADRLGVKNRLDPRESILGGARYVNFLKNNLPASTPEPDRTWQALAAYNIGPGHFNAARRIARELQVDENSWFEMKKVLPLLARPQYYARLRSGRARGGEAVILAENVRAFYDILQRRAPYSTLETPNTSTSPGLKPPAQTPSHSLGLGTG